MREVKLGVGAGRSDVKLQVGGGTASLTAGKGSERFTLASVPHGYDGYAGLMVDGMGYVEVGDLKVAP